MKWVTHMLEMEKKAAREAAATSEGLEPGKFDEDYDAEFRLRREEKKRVVGKYKPSRHSR